MVARRLGSFHVSVFRLHTPGEEVADPLRRWLAGRRLEPPRPLTFDVRVAEVEPPDTAAIFRQPELSFHRRSPDEPLEIVWERAPARATLVGDRASVVLSPAALAILDDALDFFFPVVLVFLLRRVGWHHVHGATWVDGRGRGWLFAGDRHVGKSTTTALVASLGWSVGNDDSVYLCAEPTGSVRAIADRRPIALRDGGRTLLGAVGGAFDADREKTVFDVEELGGRWVSSVVPDLLVFPRLGDATAAEAIAPREVLSELVRWSAWVALEPDLAQEHLDLLAALGAQAQCYRLTLGPDLFRDPGLLQRTIE